MKSMTDLITNYQSALNAIYEHVGFKENWVVCPIDDKTDKFWREDGKTVCYADTEEDLNSESGTCCEDTIYKQCFYNKWVYSGGRFTMIFCNPHEDGMKWFRVFDNEKRRTG